MDKSPQPFLNHIKEAIGKIESYVHGFDFVQFENDQKTQDAVVRQLEIIGEASSNLEESFKSSNPEIPWRELTDFRNVLAHEYWDIELDIIWHAVTKEVSELKTALDKISSSPQL